MRDIPLQRYRGAVMAVAVYGWPVPMLRPLSRRAQLALAIFGLVLLLRALGAIDDRFLLAAGPGVQVFTYANFGKETVRGTPVAPTRQLYDDGTGVLKFRNSPNFHEGENAGIRARIRRVTRQSEDVELKFQTVEGVAFDDLVIPFSQIKGAQVGAGGAADKTWTFTPAMTGNNSPESYSVDVGDDVQNWRCQYVMLQRIKLGAALNDVTSLQMDGFAQRAIKTAKANPAQNSAIKIPGELWTVKFAATQAGLAGAAVQLNFLQAWELEIITGLRWRHYMDGQLYGSQHVETDIAATLTMTVESTALAISEFVDKHFADTLDFVRLKATGPALGGSAYSAQFDLPVLYEEPDPIGTEDQGVNLYKVVARATYDSTTATNIAPTIVNSLATLP